MSTIILGIESSCDDTSAAVLRDGVMLSNVIASQAVHEAFGGVVPELASRAHQQNIVPVVSEAIRRAGIKMEDLNAIAFTRGPGLMGSLLVGLSFAKGLASALNIPMIDVNHLQGHVMAHFVTEPDVPKLSSRQIEVMNLVAKGFANNDIARILNISVNSVKDHLKNIYTILDVSSRTEAATIAINLKLISV